MTFRDILGTSLDIFRIGIDAAAVALKNVGSKLALRNDDDTAYLNLQLNGIEVFDADGSNKTTITQQPTTTDLTFQLPSTLGLDNQVLKTNGAGVLSWTNMGGAVDKLQAIISFGPTPTDFAETQFSILGLTSATVVVCSLEAIPPDHTMDELLAEQIFVSHSIPEDGLLIVRCHAPNTTWGDYRINLLLA